MHRTFILCAERLTEVGALCGASFINERLEKKLLQKLASEKKDLVRNGKTLESIVQARITFFENNQKRRIDTSDRKAPPVEIEIDNLRKNEKKRFYENGLVLRR